MNFLFVLAAINWQAVGLQAGQLILSLSILVIMHELGHFIPAKWFKCRVEKFYLFFDPWFSLFKKKVGETEYGVGWLPLGGYVKISGMIDESMDKEQMKKPAESWEFRSKPAWQRLIIMIGGVTVNVLLAFFIYAMILFTWGETKLPTKNMTDGVWCVDSLATNIGLQTGDKILAVNGKPVTYFEDANAELLLGEKITVERDGQVKEIVIPVNFIGQLVETGKRTALIMPRIPAIVAEVSDSSYARKAGLKAKDRIIGINGTDVKYFDQIKPLLAGKENDTINLKVLRDDKPVELKTVLSSTASIGFYPLLLGLDDLKNLKVYEFQSREYGFFESFPAGVKMAIKKLESYVAQFKKILNPSTGAYKGLGGFKAMGSIFPKYEWNWEAFWTITAFFSIALAFMNLLPIPALDGGHVLFTLYEMVSGRKPSEKFLEYAQIVGMVLLFGLLIYANGNDWFGWGRSK
ncbi:RIP metalloprotease RseP [Pollutibacter soli]|uniref:RIP metalloprotease RseP n=1 Tax=Pollutibacter soli TaxID=3034157 RepID=UPI003013930E